MEVQQIRRSLSFEDATKLLKELEKDIGQVIFGQDELIRETLCTFLAQGHILITGAPGLAKTTLVRVFAAKLGLQFGRIQFTPDLLPSDITGTEILNLDASSQKRNFEFAKGPIFTNILLADEINRASPRTQSAMLEAMQERNVTVSGKRYELPKPFMVLATQNPYESEGTFPLPEAQLDRFLLHAKITYPSHNSEIRMLKEHSDHQLIGENWQNATKQATKTIDKIQIDDLLYWTTQVRFPEELLNIIADLVSMTRPSDEKAIDEIKRFVWYGAGPRAGISLISTSKALAFLSGEECVRWQHIRHLAKPVIRHRIKLSPHALRENQSDDQLINLLLDRVESKYKQLLKDPL